MFPGLFLTGKFPGNSIKVIPGKFFLIPGNSGKLKLRKNNMFWANLALFCKSSLGWHHLKGVGELEVTWGDKGRAGGQKIGILGWRHLWMVPNKVTKTLKTIAHYSPLTILFGINMAKSRLKISIWTQNLINNALKSKETAAFSRFPGIPGKLDWIPGNSLFSGNSKSPGNITSLIIYS